MLCLLFLSLLLVRVRRIGQATAAIVVLQILLLDSFQPPVIGLYRCGGRVKELKKAERYNEALCIVKKVVDGGRLGVQLLNEDKIELSMNKENVELVEEVINEPSEP